MRTQTSIRQATLVGTTAILMFSSLAILSVLSGNIPPFQLVAMAFTIAFVIGITMPLIKGRSLKTVFSQPLKVWVIGIYGLFGYHFAYFLAVQNAPPMDANLINYLWPLLIVVMSSFLPGERTRWYHLSGAGLGLCGSAVLIIGAGDSISLGTGSTLGYGAAVAAALLWSTYSIASRRLGHVPTDAVGGFCGATAILAAICHFNMETTVIPDATQWIGVIGLGLGPVGLAFFTWDHGVKRGDIRVLGALAYATPLLSTALMIVFGLGDLSFRVGIACVLIVGGACLATWDFWFHRPAIQDDATSSSNCKQDETPLQP